MYLKSKVGGTIEQFHNKLKMMRIWCLKYVFTYLQVQKYESNQLLTTRSTHYD